MIRATELEVPGEVYGRAPASADSWGRRRLLVPALGVTLGIAIAMAGDLTGGLLCGAACLAAWLLSYPAMRLAQSLGAVSRPGGRALEGAPRPCLGGAAILPPVLAVLLWGALQGDTRSLGLAVGATLVFLSGVYDDVRQTRPWHKVLIQIAAALCLLWAGFRMDTWSLPGVGTLELGALGAPLLVLWIVLVTNAFNLVDGLDGLASGLAVLAALALALLTQHPLAALALAGACLGFVGHNLPPARGFLGDSGSLLLGFLLAALALEVPAEANVPLVCAILAYPLGDCALTILRRLVRGKSLMTGDRSHVHHKVRAHLGSRPALLLLLGFASVQLVAGVLRPSLLSLVLAALCWLGLATALVWAGKYRLGQVLAERRPLRRLHLAYRYVSGSLRLAESHSDVEGSLEHMVEILGLGRVSLNGLDVRNRRGIEQSWGPVYDISGGALRASWCSLSTHAFDRALEEERETLVHQILCEADAKLVSLDRDGASREPNPPGTTEGGSPVAAEGARAR